MENVEDTTAPERYAGLSYPELMQQIDQDWIDLHEERRSWLIGFVSVWP